MTTGTVSGWLRSAVYPETNTPLSYDNADDYVQLSNNYASDTQGTVILSLVSRGAGAQNTRCFGYGGAAATNAGLCGFGLTTALKLIAFQRSDGGTTVNNITGATVLTANTTYHVIFKSDSTKFYAYINGLPETFNATIGSNTGKWFGNTTVTAPAKTLIGSYWSNGALNTPWKGSIGSVLYLNYAISDADAFNLYRLWQNGYADLLRPPRSNRTLFLPTLSVVINTPIILSHF
jgi:hypothetical protein